MRDVHSSSLLIHVYALQTLVSDGRLAMTQVGEIPGPLLKERC